MRFTFSFSPVKSLRLPRDVSDWPLAMRFALFIVPLGLCLTMAASWMGYRAASVNLHDSLSALPMFGARMQAMAMRDTLNSLRSSLFHIAQLDVPDAYSLRDSAEKFFQNSGPFLHELSIISNSDKGFMFLRDGGDYKTLAADSAMPGQYSPFRQVAGNSHESGKAVLYPPVFFDDPGSSARNPEARVPVIRMSVPLPEGRGVLVAGINVRVWRDMIAATMKPDAGLSLQASAVRLSFFFDPKGWILFEMDGEEHSDYAPDRSRSGYSGDLGWAGYDAAFRPWATHVNYWRMVTEVADGRSGFIEISAERYASVKVGGEGFLCYTPVVFSPIEKGEQQVVGGIAFFETSRLPLSAFHRYANQGVVILVGALLLCVLISIVVGRKLVRPLRKMAHDLGAMAENSELAFINVNPVCEEQQKIQAAANTLIAGSMAAKNELRRFSREVREARSRQPADLTQPLPKPLPKAEFGLVGSSALIREVREQVRKTARAGTDVLVWGETGTGKELVAAAIHKAGNRPDSSYISLNCGALDENLLLDALFGHVKGAFSEAKSDRKGAFLAAEGGTLHLDEIANSSPKVQQALLRALSVRRIRPLGSDEEIPFNTRVVAATNVDLRECVRAGTFREDLYFRLAIISIETPPLRHRKEDLPELAAFCIHVAAIALNRADVRLSRGALDLLAGYDWPGNVREFKNCLTRALAFVEGDLILPQHITLEENAYRTYAKPLPPKILAEKIHPAERYMDGSAQAREYLPFSQPVLKKPKGAPGGALPVSSAPEDALASSVSGKTMRQPDVVASDREPGLEGLNERQLCAVAFVREHGAMTRSEYESVAGEGLSSRTAQNDLRELVERGIIIRVGAGPGTRYVAAGVA